MLVTNIYSFSNNVFESFLSQSHLLNTEMCDQELKKINVWKTT